MLKRGDENINHPVRKEYKKILGLPELVALGVGGTVGSGIFVVPGLAAGLAGSSAIWVWGLVAVSATGTLLCLKWATSRFPGTGAFYTIFRPIFGTRITVLLVILYLISTIFGIATIAAGLGQYFLYLGFSHLLHLEIAVIAAFGVLNIRGIYLSGKTENILTMMKILPLFAIALLLLPRISVGNLMPFPAVSPRNFIQAVILVYWPFTGFEISAIPADEVEDRALIGRSLLIVMGIVIALYLLLNLSLIGSLGGQVLASSSAPLATAAASFVPLAGTFLAALGIIAMASALNAYLVGGSRVLQNLAEECHTPRIRDLNRWGTPAVALFLCSFASGGLLLWSNRFGLLASTAVITTLIPYLFISVTSFSMFPEWRIRVISLGSTVMTAGILVFSLLS